MGVFDRLFAEPPEEVVEVAPSAPGETWSEAKRARWGRLFTGPREAVAALRAVGERLEARRDPERAGEPPKQVFGQEAVEDLQSFAVAAQALRPERGEVASCPRLYQELGEELQELLPRIPEVTAYRLVGGFLRAVGEDMRDLDDATVAPLGRALLTRLEEIRAARTRPALEPAGDLGPGTTTSLSEQFRAHYAREDGGGSYAPARATAEVPAPEVDARAETVPASPEPPEDPLPPATDLSAEAVFRVLLEECLRDGKLSRAETRAIAQLRDLLGLSLRRHEVLLREVTEGLEAADAGAEELDPLTFFERCCRVAVADGQVDAHEKDLLEKVGRYLHITPEEYAEIRGRLAAPREPGT